MTIDTKNLQLDEATTARHSAEYEARDADRLVAEIDALRVRAEKAEASAVDEAGFARTQIARAEKAEAERDEAKADLDRIERREAEGCALYDKLLAAARAERDALAKQVATLREALEEARPCVDALIEMQRDGGAEDSDVEALATIDAALAGTADVDVFTAAEIETACGRVSIAGTYIPSDLFMDVLKAARGSK